MLYHFRQLLIELVRPEVVAVPLGYLAAAGWGLSVLGGWCLFSEVFVMEPELAGVVFTVYVLGAVGWLIGLDEWGVPAPAALVTACIWPIVLVLVVLVMVASKLWRWLAYSEP